MNPSRLITFLAMGSATFFTRYVMIAALGRGMPDMVRRWLQYVPAAVLVALIVPAVLVPRGSLEVGRQTWAALAGAVAAWRTRSGLWTAIVGMTTFWLLQAVGL